MRTIYKYILYAPTTVIRVSPHATVLTVRVTAGEPVLYLLLDPQDGWEQRLRTFTSVPTGGAVPAGLARQDYCGTFDRNGSLFHVFETTHIDMA